jgi:hypothetical protein
MSFFQIILFTFVGPFIIFFVWFFLQTNLKRRIVKGGIKEEEIKQEQNVNRGIIAGAIFLYIFVLGYQIVFPSQQEKKAASINWIVSKDSAVNLSNETLIQILSSFENHCAGLQKYPDAIESAKVDVRKSWQGYPCDEYGWNNIIMIQVVIKNEADIPIRGIGGNTLYYFIGGGNNPGIVIKKDVSALFYGFQSFKESEDSFISDTSYRKVDNL